MSLQVQELRSRLILSQKEDIDVFKMIQAWKSTLKDQSVDFY